MQSGEADFFVVRKDPRQEPARLVPALSPRWWLQREELVDQLLNTTLRLTRHTSQKLARHDRRQTDGHASNFFNYGFERQGSRKQTDVDVRIKEGDHESQKVWRYPPFL